MTTEQADLRGTDFLLLLLLTAGAFIILGYHPAAEDASLYIPQIKKLLNPALYPFGDEFFQSHARLTLFPRLIAASVRTTHLSLDSMLLFWHLLTIFLLLLGCWKLSGLLFRERGARWAGVTLVAAILTIPIAGTALYLMDEYVNPRSFALFAAVFSVADAMKRKYAAVIFWTVLAAIIHPLMWVFGAMLVVLIVWLRGTTCVPHRPAIAAAACFLPLGISFAYPPAAYRQAIQLRHFFFVLRWHWYELLGIVLPVLLLWWLGRIARRNGLANLDVLCRALVIYELVFSAISVAICAPRLLALLRYQPMRSLQLLYLLLFLIVGGLLQQWLLRNRVWRWVALFLPLCAGMYIAQWLTFPASPHIEWPGTVPNNAWLQTFAWVRENTPVDAVFALNPYYMNLPGEDAHGFRAIAERSSLCDAIEDSGTLTMFPELPLAEHWQQQMQAQVGWENFQATDFERLRRDWGVTWIVLDQPAAANRPGAPNLDCPYAKGPLRVCRVP